MPHEMENLEESGSSASESQEEEEEEEESSGVEEEEAGEEREGEGVKKKKSRRLKARKAPGHRRNLRSKFEGVEDFNPEALSAQTEEQERIRRLELQQSLLQSSESEREREEAVSNQTEKNR